MNKITGIFIAAGMMILMAAQLEAKQTPKVTATLKAGTLGAGIEAGVDWNQYLTTRLGYNYFSLSSSIDVNDMHFETDPKLESVSLLMDVHPWTNMFRLTGGILYNGNDVELAGSTTDSASIGGIRYQPEEIGTVSGTVEYNDWAPYAGIGWVSNREQKRGWGIGIDLGVMFQGSPEINDLTSNGTMADDSLFQASLDREKQNILDEIKDFEFYPALSIMATYKF